MILKIGGITYDVSNYPPEKVAELANLAYKAHSIVSSLPKTIAVEEDEEDEEYEDEEYED